MYMKELERRQLCLLVGSMQPPWPPQTRHLGVSGALSQPTQSFQ